MNLSTHTSKYHHVPPPTSLGQHLSKQARKQLVHLCLRHIAKEFLDKPLSNNKPGRPTTPETNLAAALDVSPRTVKRWTSNPDAIQSCDENADKLAETAHSYNPQKTTEILLEDVRLYRRIVDEWLSGRRID